MADIASPDEISRYGVDAADWLKRWDAGDIVWTIEMGGMGPGYEQAIQITVAEVIRYLVDNNVDRATQFEDETWPSLSDAINKALWASPIINNLGLSGAQAGAATSLAVGLYRDGPDKVMNTESIKDRHIMVSRNFPRAA